MGGQSTYERPYLMRRAGGGIALAAAALFLASLVLFWPGYASYDTVNQYEQVATGAYLDWHPPAMARLWSLFVGLGFRDAAPMLVVQLSLYWLGFGLIAAGARGWTAVAVLAIGAMPVFLGWQGVVLKDAQMTGALLGGTGLFAWWRLRGQAVPWTAIAGAWVLIAYAMLVRANGAFAAVPLAVLLGGRGWGWRTQTAAIAIGIVAALAVLSPINQGVFGARPSGVQRTQAIYDLSGIAVRASMGADHIGLSPAAAAMLARGRCVKPFFWDPLGDAERCKGAVEPLRHVDTGVLYATLADAIVHHPLAYAGQRLAHLNSTERWLVPQGWINAAPQLANEPNDDRLATPLLAPPWQRLTGWLVETPLGWPFAWAIVAATAVAVAHARPSTPACDLSVALLASALTLEASFAVLSIASDLRYHLWPMIATAVAVALLLGEGRPSRRAIAVGGAVLMLALGSAAAARIVLPLPPQTYDAMMGPAG